MAEREIQEGKGRGGRRKEGRKTEETSLCSRSNDRILYSTVHASCAQMRQEGQRGDSTKRSDS